MRFLLLASFCVLAPWGDAVDCPDNEEYVRLGSCEATCANPNRECDWISTLFHLIPGCRCRADKGFVRNGRLSPLAPCIKAKECPQKETPAPECPENTVFRKCGSCEGSCFNPDPSCTKECRKPGCYCPVDQGYVRSHIDGRCIPFWQCPRNPNPSPWMPPPSESLPIAPGLPTVGGGDDRCGENERWSACAGCDVHCEDSGRPCTEKCRRKCECVKGFVRGWEDKCIPSKKCTAHPECARMSCPTGQHCAWYPQRCNFSPCPQVVCKSHDYGTLKSTTTVKPRPRVVAHDGEGITAANVTD